MKFSAAIAAGVALGKETGEKSGVFQARIVENSENSGNSGNSGEISCNFENVKSFCTLTHNILFVNDCSELTDIVPR